MSKKKKTSTPKAKSSRKKKQPQGKDPGIHEHDVDDEIIIAPDAIINLDADDISLDDTDPVAIAAVIDDDDEDADVIIKTADPIDEVILTLDERLEFMKNRYMEMRKEIDAPAKRSQKKRKRS